METPLRILAVDDEEGPLAVVSMLLERSNHKVTAVRDPKEALRLFKEGSFDLVITDRIMPGASGDWLAESVKAHDPSIPVLMLTGTGHTMIAQGRRPEGVDLVLGKPVTRSELIEALKKLTKKRE